MGKRKPLPYSAAENLDDAVMSLADAISKIDPFRTGTHMTVFESKWRGSESILLIERAITRLREIAVEQRPPAIE